MGNLALRGEEAYKSSDYQNALELFNEALYKESNNINNLIKKGCCLYYLESYDESINIFKKILKLKPENKEALYDIGFVEYMGKKNYTEALNMFIQCLDFSNNDNNLLEKLYYAEGLCYYQLKNYKPAIDCFFKCDNILRNNILTLNNIGRCYLELKEYDKAIIYFDKSFEESENKFYIAYYNKSEAYYRMNRKYDVFLINEAILKEYNDEFEPSLMMLGIYHYESQNYPSAKESFTRVIELNKQNIKAYFKRGNTFWKLKRYSEAIDDYNIILKINPSYLNGRVLYNKANCLRDLNQIDEAIKFYKQAIEICDSDSDYYYNLAFCYNIQNNYNECLVNLDKSININENFKNLFLKGKILYKIHTDLSEAMIYLNKSNEINNTNSECYYYKALILYDLQDYLNALTNIQNAIKNNKPEFNNLKDFYFYEGLINKNIKKYNDAIESFNKSIDVNKNNPEAFYELGSVYLSLKEYDKCFEYLDKSLKLHKDNHAALFKKGECFYNQKKYNEAIEFIEQAINIDIKNGRYFYFKGRCLYELKRKNEAVYSFEKAILFKAFKIESYCYEGICLFELDKLKDSKVCLENSLKCIYKKYKKNNSLEFKDYFENVVKVAIPKEYHKIIKDIFFYLGLIYNTNKNPESAIIQFNLSIRFDDTFSSTYYNKALCLISLNKNEEALENFDLAIKYNQHHLVYYKKGNLLFKMGRKNEAIDAYSTAFLLNPNDINAIHNKGKCYHDLKIYDKALECYNIALELNKYYDIGLYNKGKLLYDTNKKAEAKNYFLKTIQINKKDYLAYYYLGKCNLDHPEEAMKNFNECLKINPGYYLAIFEKGKIYYSQSDYEKALSLITEYLKYEPSDNEAKEIKYQCEQKTGDDDFMF